MERRIHYKVVILGSSGVGKSSIATRYIRKIFFEYSESTIGAAFLTIPVVKNNQDIILDIWDTAGQERYHSLTPMYYRGADAAIIVYDITDINTFNQAKKWYNEIRSILPDAYIILVGNKLDMEDIRKVILYDVKRFTEEYKLDLIETSARTGRNVDKLFNQLIDNIPESNSKDPISENSVLLGNNEVELKDNCSC